jgi:hypothetical protein
LLATLFVQMTGQSVILLEATAQNKFKFEATGLVLVFDHAKNQMTFQQWNRAIFSRRKISHLKIVGDLLVTTLQRLEG